MKKIEIKLKESCLSCDHFDLFSVAENLTA